MATARELLEQADALMRRNRLREAAVGPASDFPVLTDVFAAANHDVPGMSTPGAPSAVNVFVDPPVQGPAPDADGQGSVTGDVPILTEIVEDFEPISIIGAPDDGAEAALWPDFDDGEFTRDLPRQIAGEAASTARLPEAVPAAAPEADAAAVREAIAIEEPDARGTPAPVPLPANGDLDAARWVTLAEDVRMQVLQRIDIFTDTGLQEQLTARLQPIVDRASADLVATISQQVGQLLRGYVAEAIEREIEKWRHDGGT